MRGANAVLAGVAIREVQLDASLDALTQLLTGFQAVVCCLTGEALLQQKRLIDAAKTAGTVQRFIPSGVLFAAPHMVLHLSVFANVYTYV